VQYQDKLQKLLISAPMPMDRFMQFLCRSETTFCDTSLELELIVDSGFPLDIIENIVYFKPSITNIKDQQFCVVDIECSDSAKNGGQIIEIGAVKYKDGKTIDSFESLIYCKKISTHINRITGIDALMLQTAPPLAQVLKQFVEFLGEDIFVAHDAKFDYKFLNYSLEKLGLQKIANATLCTINLSKRIINTSKYGLRHLKDFLGINISNHHRAYSDALSAKNILAVCLQFLPQDIKTCSQLIEFSQSNNIKSSRGGF
jgi:DNA polymerase-3 subunit epsilon